MMSHDQPLVSVIIPSLNLGRFVKNTIDGVLMQTYKNLEIIIIDGGSTDETLAILADYQSVQFISEFDNGPADAIMKGLRLCSGELILFQLISDGLLEPDWISKCVDELQKHPAASLCWGLVRRKKESGELAELALLRWEKTDPPNEAGMFISWLTYGSGFHETNMIIRKKVALEIVLSFNLPNSKDDIFYYFTAEFHARGYVSRCIPIVASYSRIHSNQRSFTEMYNKKLLNYEKIWRRKLWRIRRKVLLTTKPHRFIDSNGAIVGMLELSIKSRAIFLVKIILSSTRLRLLNLMVTCKRRIPLLRIFVNYFRLSIGR